MWQLLLSTGTTITTRAPHATPQRRAPKLHTCQNEGFYAVVTVHDIKESHFLDLFFFSSHITFKQASATNSTRNNVPAIFTTSPRDHEEQQAVLSMLCVSWGAACACMWEDECGWIAGRVDQLMETSLISSDYNTVHSITLLSLYLPCLSQHLNLKQHLHTHDVLTVLL